MIDAHIIIEAKEAAVVEDYATGIRVHVWAQPNGTLTISVNRQCERDDLQINYIKGELATISSPDGEDLELVVKLGKTKPS